MSHTPLWWIYTLEFPNSYLSHDIWNLSECKGNWTSNWPVLQNGWVFVYELSIYTTSGNFLPLFKHSFASPLASDTCPSNHLDGLPLVYFKCLIYIGNHYAVHRYHFNSRVYNKIFSTLVFSSSFWLYLHLFLPVISL